MWFPSVALQQLWSLWRPLHVTCGSSLAATKTPPSISVSSFFNHVRRQGLPVCDIQSDEDDAHVENTEFCSTIYKSLGVVMQSTGGHASTINGAAKSPHSLSHRTIKRSLRAGLIGSLLDNTLWCFSGQYAMFIYNNCINHTTGIPLAKKYLNKLAHPSKMHPFGARVKIISELKSQRALSARTSGDLRSHQQSLE